MVETCTRAEFSARMGWKSRSNVSNLAKEGLIVFTDDGNRVQVAPSIARIEAARDPAKQGVRDRHAAERGDTRGDAPAMPSHHDYHAARATKEHYAALQSQADYRLRVGELLEAGEVNALIADVLVTLRGALEPIGATLSPQLSASTDETECRRMIDDRIEDALRGAAASFEALSRGRG